MAQLFHYVENFQHHVVIYLACLWEKQIIYMLNSLLFSFSSLKLLVVIIKMSSVFDLLLKETICILNMYTDVDMGQLF